MSDNHIPYGYDRGRRYRWAQSYSDFAASGGPTFKEVGKARREYFRAKELQDWQTLENLGLAKPFQIVVGGIIFLTLFLIVIS